MKAPYLNKEQRTQIRLKTFYGSQLELHLEAKKVLRETLKSKGYIAMKRMEKDLNRIINIGVFGR